MEIVIKTKNDLDNAIKLIVETYNKANGEKEEPQFIDLGLPSGTKWADRNLEGYFTYEEACENNAPTAVQMAELYEHCEWKWDGEKKGYIVTGPNGNSIFLPAAGYIPGGDNEPTCVGSEGDYWTKCPSKTSAAIGRYLGFYSGNVYPLNVHYRAFGFSVRPVQE